MKIFSDEIDRVRAVDWNGMASQPIEYVALAVKRPRGR